MTKPQASGNSETDDIHKKIKLIRKLRWIGWEEEAKRLWKTLADKHRGNLIPTFFEPD